MTRFQREVRCHAQSLGVTGIRITPGGKHLWLTGNVKGRPVRMPLSCSPSDFNAIHQARRRLRRMVEEER